MVDLSLSVIIAAPYAYSSVPIELFFAYLKQGEANPDGLTTGKK